MRGRRDRDPKPLNKSSFCFDEECEKPHEFLQFEGKYFCLECFDKYSGEGDDDLVGKIMEVADDKGAAKE